MGISPPTDLVVDVMKNADTSRVRQVVNKLQALSAGGAAEFSATMVKTGTSGASSNAGVADKADGASLTDDEQARARALSMIPAGVAFSGTSLTTLRNAHALSGRSVDQFATAQPQAAALKKFEGMVLSKFLDTMMPATSSVFGKGTAGSTWKTMLTEKMGEAIANGGGIGIAANLARAAARRSGGTTGEGS
ncbi:rod-binding protein [Xanthobacter sediminis]|uniref:rod-binding protein n=1 Tax=Xanthobacter sediminis TaxID=3119926 RepID=UPI00372C028B